MTLDDFRKLRDEAHKEWNETRASEQAARDEVDWALEQLRKAQLRVMDAHGVYKERKDWFRVARDYKLGDIDQVRMVLKLKDGGAQ